MQTLNRIAIAAGVVVVAGVVLWILSRGPSAPPPVEEARGTRPPAARPAGSSADPAPAPRAAPPAPPATPLPAAAPPAANPAAAAPAVVEAPPPAAAPPPPAPAPARAFQGEVSGRVLLLSDRSPVQGATVVLQRKWNPAEGRPKEDPQSLVTESTGEFRFQSVPAGTFEVRVSLQGYAPRTLPAVVLEEGAAGAAGLEALLVKGGAVEGVVVDERGAPAEGLTVRAHRSATPFESAEAVTGPDGKYRIENLTPGPWILEVQRAEGRTQSVSATVLDTGTTRADFRSGASISGTLVDAEGSLLAGAIVRARPKDMKGGYTSRNTKTDDAGLFTIADLQPGEWVVSVQVLGEAGFAADVSTVKVGADPVTVALRLERGEIAGLVTLKATGKAVAQNGAQISLYPLAQGKDGKWTLAGISSFMAFLDAEGRYRFRGLGPGRYRLTVYPHEQGLRPFEKDLDLRPGERMERCDATIEEMKTGTVRFTVRDQSGKAVEGVSLCTVIQESPTSGTSTTLHADAPTPGVYIATLEAGKHLVSLRRPDAGSAQVTVEVREGAEIQVAVTLKPPR